MLIRFSSIETESVLMLGDIAVRLIRMLGSSEAVPGAIDAASVPLAVQRLREQLSSLRTANSEEQETDNDNDGKAQERLVTLATHAQPLIDILDRAAAAKVPVMWDKV